MNTMKHLGYSIADATFQPKEVIAKMYPYSKEDMCEGRFYGLVEFRPTDPEKLNHIGQPVRTVYSCIVEVSDAVKDDIAQCYFPGGVHVNFYQQSNGHWLVAFKAMNILAAKYLRLTNEDMTALLKEFGFLNEEVAGHG